MLYDRIFNFSAGPAVMPVPVLEEIRDELMNYRGAGMSVLEMRHRSATYQKIIDDAESDLRDLMGIPDNYKVLFIQGGATLQFAMIPMNLMKNGTADYIVTGNWSLKASQEAARYGKVNVIASSEDKKYSYVPDCSDLPVSADADYVYICENETVQGNTYWELPDTKGKILVSDQSSMFLSRPCDVSKYGLIYAGIQKNIGPAGMAVVIIREDLIREDLPVWVPTYLRYHVHAGAGSMYNTPNSWAIYCSGKIFAYLKQLGGLEAVAENNRKKAEIIYDFLDASKVFSSMVEKKDRSVMNVPFTTGTQEEDDVVFAKAQAAGFESLRGHVSVGGLRASIYNSMPNEGVAALVEFLKQYEAERK